MKLPEMPGRIIVQIAIAPHIMMNQPASVVWVGESRQIIAPRKTPKTSQSPSATFQPLMS